ncbi:retron St85 family RNA-directed DNA polymerase [Halomonas denitrificans]|nr:retron St85 family RNA-directed DNA polymerase [Halomonas denitrificans]
MKKRKELTTKLWEDYFLDRGLSSELRKTYLEYINFISEKDLPVIFETEHLSNLIGINYQSLNSMVNNPDSFYRSFKIKKKRGGSREISAPYPSLMMCQTWIYENILVDYPIHHCAQAYRSKHSIVTNAKIHLGSRTILKMDLKDFFSSIPINWVIQFFSNLGYPNNLSYALASLCCLEDCLPQGAPTSPALSNILLISLDRRLYRLGKKYNLSYTRYADDLVFSGSYIPHKFIKVVANIVTNFGLTINDEKSQLIIGDKQKIVTGISISGSSPCIPRKTKREIKKELHFIKKYGLVSHVGKMKIRNPNYLASLEGKIRFWLQVEPNNKFALESLLFIRSKRA